LNIFESLLKEYKRNGSYKYCFYHNKSECSGKIKKAHSIQKEKVLSQLESNINGNNLVYTLNEFREEQLRIVELIPIGKNKASIFTGFCDFHDSKLFSPIENDPFKGNNEQLFLFAYRAFAHGFHQVVEQLKFYTSKSLILNHLPLNYLNDTILFTANDIREFSGYKKILNNLIETKKFDGLNHYYKKIKPFVPIACSSVLSPLYTYKNIFLNPSNGSSYLMLTIIPNFDETIVCISNFKDDRKGRILLDELKSLPDEDFKEAISSLLIYCTTNTFFSPTLWNKFSNEEKQQLYNEINFCIKEGGKIEKFFVSKTNFFK